MSGAGGAGAGTGSAIDRYQKAHEEYEVKRQYHTELVAKVEKLHGDMSEHQVVLRALEAVPGDRRAFSLVGGVLVERTAAQVIPALQTNLHGVRGASNAHNAVPHCVGWRAHLPQKLVPGSTCGGRSGLVVAHAGSLCCLVPVCVHTVLVRLFACVYACLCACVRACVYSVCVLVRLGSCELRSSRL